MKLRVRKEINFFIIKVINYINFSTNLSSFKYFSSADPATSGVSRAEGGAAASREEASRWPGEGPPPGECPEAGPGAAARAAGAGGKAKHARVSVQLLFRKK